MIKRLILEILEKIFNQIGKKTGWYLNLSIHKPG